MEAGLDSVINRALESGKITGVVMLVHRNGKPVYRRAAGLADREAGIPVAFDTIFRMASVTKPIVASTALALVERGLLSLSDPVAEHLPWFRPPLADGTVPDITLHHLLTHTSGLMYNPLLEELPDDQRITMGISDTDLDFEAIARFVRLGDQHEAARAFRDWLRAEPPGVRSRVPARARSVVSFVRRKSPGADT